MEAFEENPVKVVLLGDSGVGKTCLAVRFVMDQWTPYQEATIGASFLSKTIQVPTNSSDDNDDTSTENNNNTQQPPSTRKLALKIWDTAGQEKYHSLASMYYRGAAACILVYDICNRATFLKLQEWVEEVRKNGPRDIVLAICGNKNDLLMDRHVSYAEGLEYAQSVHAIYIETSARDNTNVMELFMEVGKRVPVTTTTTKTTTLDGVDLSRQAGVREGSMASCPC